MSDDNNFDWINARGMNRVRPRPTAKPKIDETVSQIVGKKVLVNDRRLIQLVAKWKQAKNDPESVDDFLNDGAKVDELRKVFNAE